MAYDREQIKLTFSGYLGESSPGSEEFAFGLHLSGSSGLDSAAALLALDVDAIDAATITMFQSANVALSSKAVYNRLKAAAVGTNGHYIPGADPVEVQSNGDTGYEGGSGVRYPNQIALCVSLRTGTSIGVATRGRFYLPLPGATVNAEGRVSSGFTAGAVADIATWLNAINDIANTGSEPTAVSLMSAVGTSPTRTRGVTSVLVGDVLDTIQARRRSLTETYASAAVTV